jgi:hypothetical protein
MRGIRNVLYIAAAAGMLIYALPLLDIGGGFTLPTVFAIVWLCFALMIIAAHLHHLLGVDEAERERLAQIKRMRKWQMQQLFLGKKRLLHLGKKSDV